MNSNDLITDIINIIKSEGIETKNSNIAEVLNLMHDCCFYNNSNFESKKAISKAINKLCCKYDDCLVNLSNIERYELIKKILEKNIKYHKVVTPSVIYEHFLPCNLSYKNKILLTDIKDGGTLLKILIELISKNPNNVCEVYDNIFAYSYNSEVIDFIKQATKFIFHKEYIVNKGDFLSENFENNYYNYIFSNPPFGVNYPLDYQNKIDLNFITNKKFISSEVLFVEKITKLIFENTVAAIILPNSILENSIYKNIRNELKEKFDIFKIISLPGTIFKNASNIKTSIVHMGSKGSKNEVELEILSNEKNAPLKIESSIKIPYSDLNCENFSPEFYIKKNKPDLEIFNSSNCFTISDIATIKKDKAPILKDSSQKICYVDISSVKAINGVIDNPKYMDVLDAPKRAYYEAKTNDLIVAVSGSGIGTKNHSMAVIDEKFNNCICSNAYKVLTLKNNINPYYLWYFMRSGYFLNQFESLISGSMIPNIKESDFLALKVIVPNYNIQLEIAKKVKDNIAKYNNSMEFLLNAEKDLCNYIN